ncbi:geranylgeranyl reductase family protein [Halococcoides cellulosivorans]|uniref:Electron transfer flavoprotein n=1 Tax=Halococcoides cellulosivorans TaxID=1679096 RepID=A0A2R4X4J8_9EURY|nr:geranylgeranyl reductase family protein [Halococcoides cellulosivorans]AWB28725.1 electron transfer flavoprotein [Halococcoides cellulosivorans]
MHDVIVVGAGPAGSRYARQAAASGQSVLVLERGPVGEPLACSGHVSRDIWERTPEGTREAIVQNQISGARFHVGGPDSPAHAFYRDETISEVIDRVALDRHLASAAEDAGADLRVEHTVVDATEDATGVTVTARTPEGRAEFRAKILVGADGPRSRVRQSIGLPEPDELLHGVLGFDTSADNGDRVDVHLDVPGFFAWRIPRGEAGVEYGLAARPEADPVERFEAMTDAYGVETARRCSGLIPIGPPDRVTADRTLLLGDAAAQTKPFTGGGINYGMTAADHAARTVDPSDPATLADYERAWREDLGREIAMGAWIRRAYDLPNAVQRVGLRLTSGRVGVHMDRPSTIFSFDQLRAFVR